MSAGGITQADPNISYPTYYGGRYYVITPDGAEHPLGHTSNGFRSVDGAGYLFQPSDPSLYPTQLTPSPTTTGLPTLPGNQGGTITDDKGIVYSGSTITDPDNNTILFTSNGVTDSVNRTIPGTMTSVSTSNCPVISASQYPAVQYQPVVSAAEWDIPTVGGGTAPYIFCTASVNISSNLALLGGGSQMKKTVDLLQSVKLPNGQFWGFLYDSADPNNPQSYAYGQLTTPGATLEVNGTTKIDSTLQVSSSGISFPGNSTPQTTPWTGVLCGGDYAEAVDPAGDKKTYEPGDVLVIAGGSYGGVNIYVDNAGQEVGVCGASVNSSSFSFSCSGISCSAPGFAAAL